MIAVRRLPAWMPPLWLLLLVTVGYFILARFIVHLGDATDDISIYWVANAFLFTALLRRQFGEWPVLLLAGALADFFAYLPAVPMDIAAGVAISDAAEVLIACALASRFLTPLRKLSTRQLFLVGASLTIACVAGATIGALTIDVVGKHPLSERWFIWITADLLGYLTLAPLLLTLTDRGILQRWGRSTWIEFGLLSLGLGLAAYFTFSTDQPFLFILFPLLFLVSYRLSLAGSGASTFIVALFAYWFTVKGSGPIASAGIGFHDSTFYLQGFLFVCFLTTFPVAIVVERDKLLSSALRDAREKAEEATQAKTDFLASMSHEIRTPLNSVIGFADLLFEDPRLDEAQRRQVALIQNSGTVLLSVVNDILDFSKIEARMMRLEDEPFAMETLVDNSVSIVRRAAEQKGLEMRVSFDKNIAPYYRGDELRLRQVLLNLLNNAIKFTDDGWVSAKVCKGGENFPGRDCLRFEVADAGPGIAPEHQTRLFQRFSQADVSITRKYGGTGLGLSISKRLVELMGGKIGLSSEVGKGSTFWFEVSLPRSERPKERSSTTQLPTQPAQILLVEDLPMNQELACAVLTRAGHSVDIANDGEEAVSAVQKKRYDLVLMDIQMPRMDGITATKEIRRLPPPAGIVPILAMTANVLPQQVAETKFAGMNGHVAKPIKFAELARAIASALPEDFTRQAGGTGVGAGDAALELPPFQADVYEAVRSMLPPERLEVHLRSLYEQLVSTFENPIEDGVEAAAHKIVSQAGMLGFPRMSAVARELEEALRDGRSDEELLRKARTEAGETRLKLHALSNELAGSP
ncbi:MAG: ATP-binding protein [Pseudomonadota bacterium]|nr:ATP-binding protein [Pseudomonadota bacterium]